MNIRWDHLRSLWLTVKVSAIATLCTLLMRFPVAFVMLWSRWAMVAGALHASMVSFSPKAGSFPNREIAPGAPPCPV